MQITAKQTITDLKYRADIDGLRALAVLSVLGFHAFPRWVPGGFVGVDVFFVISGFLITTIILTELQQEKFRLRTFYAKRIRRIFPALLLVLVSCCLIGWLVLIETEYETLGKQIVGGSTFASNFVLMSESGYFDSDAALKPLLHLWSLSIEEQFYIVWPLLIYILWKLKLPLGISLSLLIFLSFGLNLTSVQNQPVSAFYSPLSRAWELASGGLLATLILSHREILRLTLARFSKATSLRRETIREILSVIGLIFILGGVLFLDTKKPYPGWWALLPTLGTILVIIAGTNTCLNKKLLSHRSIVAIGLISYPLYLWHWPLLSILQIIKGGIPSAAARLFVLLLSFLLAWLTYRFIEKPVRLKKNLVLMNSLLYVGMFGLGYFGSLMWGKSVAPRSAYYGLSRYERAVTEWSFPFKTAIGITLFQGDFKPLQFHGSTFYTQLIKSEPNKVLYIGDSQMQVAAARIKHLIETQPKDYKSAVFATAPGCPPIPNLKKTSTSYLPCTDFPQDALAYAAKSEIRTVVIGARWADYLNSEHFYYEEGPRQYLTWNSSGAEKAGKALEKILLSLKRQKKRVYLMLEIPVGHALDPATMIVRDFNIRQLKFDFKRGDSTGTSRTKLKEMYGKVEERLKGIARRTGVIVIDPKLSLCGADVCPALTKDGEPMYKDAWHLRPSYMRDHGTFMDQTLRK